MEKQMSISIPREVPDLWHTTMDNARLSGQINKTFNLGFIYSGGMFLSPPAKSYAQTLMSSAGRVINGGVCDAKTFYISLKRYSGESIPPHWNESADWIAFEKGIAINSDSYSTGLIKYSDVESFVVVKKGVRLPFSVKMTDGITLINVINHEATSFQVMSNFMGNDSLREILKFVGIKNRS